jgi:hypothetical protein
VYFICYTLLEALTPLMVWIIGSFSWLLLRCLFTYLMLSQKTAGASRVLSVMRLKEGEDFG